MAESLLIAFDERGGYRWLRPGLDAAGQSGDLPRLAQAAEALEAVLLLPATWSLLVEVELPIKNPAQLRQALPFALEDKLADDVERYHLVWRRLDRQRLAVAATDKARLAESVRDLQQAGIQLIAAYPEALCLPFQADVCSIVVEGEQAVLRYGPWLGGGIETESLPLLLNRLRQQQPDCRSLSLWGDADPSAWVDPQDWPFQLQPLADRLRLLSGQIGQLAGFNLLSGEFAVKRADDGQWRRRWLPAAALLMLALLLQLTGGWLSNRELQRQLQQLEQQTQALFQQTFPDIKRIVNVKVQADQRWQELQQQQQTDNRFLRLLHGAGLGLQQAPGLTLRGLYYDDSGLRLRLSGDQAQIDGYRQALSGQWQAVAGPAQTTPQGVEVEINVAER